jgi:hypothetical protein
VVRILKGLYLGGIAFLIGLAALSVVGVVWYWLWGAD